MAHNEASLMRLNKEELVREHTFGRGVGEGALEICHVFADSAVVKQ